MSDTNTLARPSVHPGIELANVLQQNGIIDSTVADKSGISRSLMSQITNGKRSITPSSAVKICKVIGGDPTYWVRRQREHRQWSEDQSVRAKT